MRLAPVAVWSVGDAPQHGAELGGFAIIELDRSYDVAPRV